MVPWGIRRAIKASKASKKRAKSKSKKARNKDDRKLLLQVKKCHYNAIMAKRKLWEARTMFYRTGRPSLSLQLGFIGRSVILQSGPGTNNVARITDVRLYYGQAGMSPIKEMLIYLGSELLPDAPPTLEARIKQYEECYHKNCELDKSPFIAMRLEVDQV
jgi:hypothetical protein